MNTNYKHFWQAAKSDATLMGALILICGGAGLTVALVFMAHSFTDAYMIELVQALHSGSVPFNYDQATEVAQSRTLFMAMAVVGTVMTMAGLFIAYNWVRARPLLSEIMQHIGFGILALGLLVLAVAALVGGVGVLLHSRDTLEQLAFGVGSVLFSACLLRWVFDLVRALIKPLASKAKPSL
jgi:hypothetical protein